MYLHRLPPLNALRAFEASARRGSFAGAAHELSVTAAAISHKIKELETKLEVTLFQRKPRGVVLTEAGRRYRDRIAAALQMIEGATAELGKPVADGPLTVSMPQSLAHHWLVPRLGRLATRLPGLEITIQADSQLVDLHERQADIGIRFGSGNYPGLRTEYLFGDAVSVLACEDLVRAAADTRACTLLRDATLLEDYRVTAAEPWSAWLPWLREAGITDDAAHRKIRFSDSSMAVLACRDSLGFCVGRMSFAFDYLRRRELRALFPWRSTEYAYHLVMRPADEDNPRVMAFRSWLVDEISAYVSEVREAVDVELGRLADIPRLPVFRRRNIP